MATMQTGTLVTVEDLLAAVKQLPPDKLNEFAGQFIEWCGERAPGTEIALIQATRRQLPPRDQRRLRALSSKSETDALSPRELQEYQRLAQRAQEIDVDRVRALAELARRWGKPVDRVIEEIGWVSANDGG